jgi:hypothetical protein
MKLYLSFVVSSLTPNIIEIIHMQLKSLKKIERIYLSSMRIAFILSHDTRTDVN